MAQLIKFASQISNKLKEDVPESVRVQARLMAQQELEARLAELNMTSADADSYGARLTAVQAHIAQLRDLLERLCIACVCPYCGTVLSDVCVQTCPPARRSAYG